MSPQLPMSFNFQGPFNLTGNPNSSYSLVTDANGVMSIVEGAGPDSVNLETDVTGILPVANGGTGAANLDALAASGANSDITSLSGLSTPLSTDQGGTGAANLDALAKSGANSDITSLSGLTTPLGTHEGGTGSQLFSSGQATFASADSVDVVDATITADSIVVVTEASSTPANTYAVVVNATVGFTIYSSAASTATVNYLRIN